MAGTDVVSAGKPKAVSGAIYVAPIGSTAPTDASTALDEAFKSVGYISDDGVTNSPSIDSEKVKSWGGLVVMSEITGREDAFKFTMISSHNIEALKLVYGDEAVSESSGAITIKAGKSNPSPHMFVIETIVAGAAHRIFIPRGVLSDVGDITYNDSDPVSFEVTIDALAVGTEGTHTEFVATGA